MLAKAMQSNLRAKLVSVSCWSRTDERFLELKIHCNLFSVYWQFVEKGPFKISEYFLILIQLLTLQQGKWLMVYSRRSNRNRFEDFRLNKIHYISSNHGCRKNGKYLLD